MNTEPEEDGLEIGAILMIILAMACFDTAVAIMFLLN